jgi:hypothetical protein
MRYKINWIWGRRLGQFRVEKEQIKIKEPEIKGIGEGGCLELLYRALEKSFRLLNKLLNTKKNVIVVTKL